MAKSAKPSACDSNGVTFLKEREKKANMLECSHSSINYVQETYLILVRLASFLKCTLMPSEPPTKRNWAKTANPRVTQTTRIS